MAKLIQIALVFVGLFSTHAVGWVRVAAEEHLGSYGRYGEDREGTWFHANITADDQGVLAGVSARRTSSDVPGSAAGPAGTISTEADTVLPEPADEPPVVYTPQLPNRYAPAWELLAGCAPGEEPYVRYVDQRFDGLDCLPDAPDPGAVRFGPPPVDPREIALDVVEHLPLPDIQIRVNPDLGLVGLPGWFWVEGYDGRAFTAAPTVTVPAEVGPEVPADLVPSSDPRRQGSSYTVEVRVWPSRYAWSFGDGASVVTASLGKPFPEMSDVQHIYEYSSLGFPGGFPVQLTIEFAAEFRVNGGPSEALPAMQRTYTASYRVQEAQAVLVGP